MFELSCLRKRKNVLHFCASHWLFPDCVEYLFIVTFATDAVKLGVKERFIIDECMLFTLLNEVLAGGEKGKGSGGGGLVKPSSLFGLWTQFNMSF